MQPLTLFLPCLRCSFSSEAKKRIADASGVTTGDVTLLLQRYDQFKAFSEWFRWRDAEGEDLPSNFSEMGDMMKEDRRAGHKYPRLSAMDYRMKAMRPKMKKV